MMNIGINSALENLKNPLESAKIILLKTKNMPKNELFHQIHHITW